MLLILILILSSSTYMYLSLSPTTATWTMLEQGTSRDRPITERKNRKGQWWGGWEVDWRGSQVALQSEKTVFVIHSAIHVGKHATSDQGTNDGRWHGTRSKWHIRWGTVQNGVPSPINILLTSNRKLSSLSSLCNDEIYIIPFLKICR